MKEDKIENMWLKINSQRINETSYADNKVITKDSEAQFCKK